MTGQKLYIVHVVVLFDGITDRAPQRQKYRDQHSKTIKNFSENYIVRSMNWIDVACNGFYISVTVNSLT